MSPMTNLSLSISPTTAVNNFIIGRCLLLSSSYVSCPHPSTTPTVCCAAAKGGAAGASSDSRSSSKKTSSGDVFEPFEQVKNKFNDLVPCLPQQSVARQIFSHDSEASINQHINVEYNVSYVYHAMYAYFDRDNVGLKGFAKFFKESSDEKREHAEKFMEYQNKRGGKVKLHSILMPLSEFDHPEKGDALHTMELALSLEKLTNEKLLHVYEVATRNNDVHLAHFVKDEFLGEQVESIKKLSEYVAQLRRIGTGHGCGILIRCFSGKVVLPVWKLLRFLRSFRCKVVRI